MLKYVLFALLLGPLAVGGSYWVYQQNTLPDPYTPQVERPYKATSASIAVPNHKGRVHALYGQVEQGAHPDLLMGTIFGLELTSARILGDFAAYQRLETALDKSLSKHPESKSLRNLKAKFNMAVHRFKLVDPQDLTSNSDRLHLKLLRTPKDEKLLAQRKTLATLSESYGDFLLLGGALLEAGDYQGADEAFDKALKSYRDVSPFPYAWLYYHKGRIAAKLAQPADLPRAKLFLETAISYVPEYTKARAELAEVYAAEGDLRKAVAVLLPVQDVKDPDVDAKLYRMLKKIGQSELAEEHRLRASQSYAALVAQYPLAFQHHADEFYHY